MNKWTYDGYVNQWWCYTGRYYGHPSRGNLVEYNGVLREF